MPCSFLLVGDYSLGDASFPHLHGKEPRLPGPLQKSKPKFPGLTPPLQLFGIVQFDRFTHSHTQTLLWPCPCSVPKFSYFLFRLPALIVQKRVPGGANAYKAYLKPKRTELQHRKTDNRRLPPNNVAERKQKKERQRVLPPVRRRGGHRGPGRSVPGNSNLSTAPAEQHLRPETRGCPFDP